MNINRQDSIRLGAVAVLGFLASTSLAADFYHPSHLHHSLHELRLARNEMLNSKHDFGGHKQVALIATNDAIRHLEYIVNHANHKDLTANLKSHANDHSRHHSHIHHALHELREARHELRETKHDFGGQKSVAIGDMNIAIEQLALIVKYYKK